MRLLLDTHVLLWWLGDDRRLGMAARAAIGDPTASVHVSAASAWEMGIKSALGKLTIPDDLAAQLSAQGFEEVPITVADGVVASALPRLHADPFDRMIIAQAQRRDLVVVTADPQFTGYDVRLLQQ